MTTAIFILPDQIVTGWGGATVSLIFLTVAIYFYLTMGQHVGEVQLLVLYF